MKYYCILLFLVFSSVTFAANKPLTDYEGTLIVQWGDTFNRGKAGSVVNYYLHTGDQKIKLRISDEMKAAPHVRHWLGKQVKVRSTTTGSKPAEIRANSIELLSSENSSHELTGSQPWVSLLCKFSDITDEPEDLNYFQEMYANQPGGLDHYWREVSYNNINVAGSIAVDWVTLPSTHETYIKTPGEDGAVPADTDLDLLFNDCVAAADPFVDFSNADGNGNSFVGINLMFNELIGCCAWGGGITADLDGESKHWRTTWNPPWAFRNVSVIVHEMGHGFGLPHTNNSDMDFNPYDNPWDVMSMLRPYVVEDPVYGGRGKHINAYHKLQLGWIEPTEIFNVSGDTNATIIIDETSLASTSNYRMAQINLENQSYYTIEARKKAGEYEAGLPGSAIIIHHITNEKREPSWVVDADNPAAERADTEGVMWKVGETFVDMDNGFKLEVLAETTNGFEVNIVLTDKLEKVDINTPFSSGSQLHPIKGLVAMPDAEFQAVGLVKPTIRTEVVVSDGTPFEPFNGDGGNIVELFDVPADALLLRATIGNTQAFDMDLYIGLDSNGNGSPDEDELVCFGQLWGVSDELCEIVSPAPGQWWVMMQAFLNPVEVEATLSAAVVVGTNAEAVLTATGPAILAENSEGQLRVSWRDVQVAQDEQLWGAIAVGTTPSSPQDLVVVPVTYTRTGEEDIQKSIILGNDSPASFALPAGATHKRLVFDVPPGGGVVDFSLTADNRADNRDIKFRVHRMAFRNAFNDAPFVTEMPANLQGKGRDRGGPQAARVSVSDAALTPGRYYIAVENIGDETIGVTARAVYQGGSERIKPRTGVWGDGSYGAGGAQGFEYGEVNGVWFGIWYTYNEDGTPTWYSMDVGVLDPMNNSHTVDILEFTNNPKVNPPTQKFTVVGKATFTAISETDMKISYTLNGEYGGSSAAPLSTNTCILQGGNPAPITGTWAPDINIAGGIGGSSVEYGVTEALIHYIYDDTGEPVWVISGNQLAVPAYEAWEFRGFCPTCTFVPPTYSVIGTVSQTYTSDTQGSHTLDFTLLPPNNSVFDRRMDVFRLGGAINCQ
ncbi:MAG: hypothetical protein L3J24_00025 [Xanthomonadales bacterium]|nr:hypothetical protein [Xanthomonadales bacterium]